MIVTRFVIDPIKTQYIDFQGRTSRESFWAFVSIYFSFALCISTFEMVIGTIFMTVMSSFALMLPSLAITARRLHDIGMSGWWQLVGFIPIIGIVFLVLLLTRKGSEVPNDYGLPESLAAQLPPEVLEEEPEVTFYN